VAAGALAVVEHRQEFQRELEAIDAQVTGSVRHGR
jgi:hypothetical protein